MRVTKAFLPHFRKRKSGLFLVTTSIGGHVAFPIFSVYHATKWALEGWAESLWYELNQLNIRVKTISPGIIRTDFDGRSMVLADHIAYKETIDRVVSVYRNPKGQMLSSSAMEVAEVVYRAATDGKSQLRYLAGKDAKLAYRIRHLFGYKFFMSQMKKRFFKS